MRGNNLAYKATQGITNKISLFWRVGWWVATSKWQEQERPCKWLIVTHIGTWSNSTFTETNRLAVALNWLFSGLWRRLIDHSAVGLNQSIKSQAQLARSCLTLSMAEVGRNTHFWKINISVKTAEFVICVQNLWICAVNEEILKNVINIHMRFSISAALASDYCLVSWSVIAMVSGYPNSPGSPKTCELSTRSKKNILAKNQALAAQLVHMMYWQCLVFKPISCFFEWVLGLQVPSLTSVDQWQQTWVVVQNLDMILFRSNMNCSFIALPLCFVSRCLHSRYYLANGILFIKQYFQIKITNNLQHV